MKTLYSIPTSGALLTALPGNAGDIDRLHEKHNEYFIKLLFMGPRGGASD